MSPKLAQRRAAKAVRRKRVLTEKRSAASSSLGECVRHLAARPLHCCLMQAALFEHGIGVVLLARQLETGALAIAAFLVDVFCLGIKDVGFQVIQKSELGGYLRMIDETMPMTPIDPSYARKLLSDAAAYAARLGLRPPRDFAAIEQLFGGFSSEVCTETFRFGCNGKPLYAPGPSESVAQIRRRVATLMRTLGPDGFALANPFDDAVEEVAELPAA
ncbi:MAG: hypothetical protein JO038_02370 [Alphaproteobacteria bacterium]|nr:hypothetical protein [Alphaproteobacteria bacterium]